MQSLSDGGMRENGERWSLAVVAGLKRVRWAWSGDSRKINQQRADQSPQTYGFLQKKEVVRPSQ